jgi:hypothetical protein
LQRDVGHSREMKNLREREMGYRQRSLWEQNSSEGGGEQNSEGDCSGACFDWGCNYPTLPPVFSKTLLGKMALYPGGSAR